MTGEYDRMESGPGRGPSPTAADSEQQLRRARCGDREGFAELYRRLAPALHGWASLRIHPGLRGQLDAEDLIQEVWWRAMDSFATFDPARASFRTWVFKIANNVLLDAFRRLRRGNKTVEGGARSALGFLPEERVAELTSISRQVARDETLDRLVAAVAAMEEDDRRLFVHCGLEGLTVAETAGLCGMTEAAAAKRWQRLKAGMRESPAWTSILRWLADRVD